MTYTEYMDEMSKLLKEHKSKLRRKTEPEDPRKSFVTLEVTDKDPHTAKVTHHPFEDTGDMTLALIYALGQFFSEETGIPSVEITRPIQIMMIAAMRERLMMND